MKAALNTRKEAELAFREILGDTFAGLAKSADFNEILSGFE